MGTRGMSEAACGCSRWRVGCDECISRAECLLGKEVTHNWSVQSQP